MDITKQSNQLTVAETKKSYKQSLGKLTTQLTNFSLSEIVSGKAENQRITLYDSERLMSIQDCVNAKPIFATKQALGEDNLLKIVVFIIWSFQKALKLPNDRIMDSMDLVICAGDYIDKYTHDTITDLVFALRQARHDGKIFYNKFSQQDFNEILKLHFETKSKATEIENRTRIETITNLKMIETAHNILNSKSDFTNGESYETFKAREKARKMSEMPVQKTLSETDWEQMAETHSKILIKHEN